MKCPAWDHLVQPHHCGASHIVQGEREWSCLSREPEGFLVWFPMNIQ